jgi:YesN/AraC family two-component response regulator
VDLNSLKNLELLYIEDEADVMSQTKLILDDFVKVVHTAKDGEEGLKMALELPIDIIIADINMPKMNGIDMIKALKNEHEKDIPCIITTAHTDTEYLIDAINLKVDGYIIKPINIKDLINSVYTVMLPIIQKKEIEGCAHVVESLAALVGGKKIEILKFIIDKLDDDKVFYGSYQDIMDALDVSKPTVVNMFKQLIGAGILEKVKNKVYRFKRTDLIS